MGALWRVLFGLALVVFFGATALAAVAFGVTLDGRESPAIQCTKSAPRPEVGGPYLESTVVTGERTWLPLGVDCTYDSPDDEVGPQTVTNSNWVATVMAVACSALAVYGVVMIVGAVRSSSGDVGSPL
ncbi:hypothetical protein ITJ38_11680 [Agreia pratensis]|uniref:hypothetical protein n=1 Tax=Agreia pratensis TaxID=150121 RepID=UPI00111BDF6C|nr:hypothetical protein [Agreia pratensis]MBF4635065.1 hypothetical protein [Agreia pratensis]